jgi:hypothetical protein
MCLEQIYPDHLISKHKKTGRTGAKTGERWIGKIVKWYRDAGLLCFTGAFFML